MQRILFLRDFKPTKDGGIRTSGGQIKVRDYFMHALQHPQLDPYFYFTPRSSYESSELWSDIPRERIVLDLDGGCYDLAFVTGKDWKLLSSPAGAQAPTAKPPGAIATEAKPSVAVIHYLQSLEQCDKGHALFPLLKRPAHRICASEAVDAASAPHRAGEAVVIENGIPLDVFAPGGKRPNSALIWGRKNPSLAERLHAGLHARGIDATLLVDYVTRDEFARRLGESEIFVGIPKRAEGFFLPALEAMASGCAVVCPDASGNRGFCIHGETCLVPGFDDADSYLDQVDSLRDDAGLKARLQRNGLRMAGTRSLEAEREQFHRFIDDVVPGEQR